MDNAGLSPLRGLAKLRDAKTRRFSSYDRTGGNDDRLHIEPGQTVVIAEHDGAGIVTHIWATLACESEAFLRKIVLRAYWDGEAHPSIETPIGDFFGMGHARTRNFASLPVQASPEDGKAFNCYFPMPFASHMRFTVTNEAEDDLLFYYYVDLELHEELEEGLGRFHAQYRQQRPDGIDETGLANEQVLFGGEDTDGNGNYTILEAEGHGHYVGVLYSVYSRRRSALWDWYGEGDDMIFVDGEPGISVPDTVRKPDPRIGPKAELIDDRGETGPGANDAWPPTLHGTGTEDYFNTAWCPTQDYSAPYHGIIAAGGPNWTEPVTLYRWHIEDPVIFHKRIRVTIEHGHANRRSDDISSVAFWYQAEPHKPFEALADVEDRIPTYRAPYHNWNAAFDEKRR
ncbi:glycoside hydrolase family 172 protein [Mesorhizobium sp. M0678]|uniref:glycoside hydrolase family 172 protein n=1 Tax=Mesorhizobium sp. M0678 TaxID=2956985 RepID=UPI00333DBA98